MRSAGHKQQEIALVLASGGRFGAIQAGVYIGRASLVDPSGLRGLIERHLPCGAPESARIPMHVATTKLLSGAPVVLSTDPALVAMLASCAIPGVFPPVCINGVYLIDGGVANNTPVMDAVALGTTRLVVLSAGFSCALKATPSTGALASALHALNRMVTRQLVRILEQLAGQVDVATVPPLCPLEVSAYDFSRAQTSIGAPPPARANGWRRVV